MIHCPLNVTNGNISSSCQGLIGEKCYVLCDNSVNTVNIVCLPSGSWDKDSIAICGLKNESGNWFKIYQYCYEGCMTFCVFKLLGIWFCLVIISDYPTNRVNRFDIFSSNRDSALFKEKKKTRTKTNNSEHFWECTCNFCYQKYVQERTTYLLHHTIFIFSLLLFDTRGFSLNRNAFLLILFVLLHCPLDDVINIDISSSCRGLIGEKCYVICDNSVNTVNVVCLSSGSWDKDTTAICSLKNESGNWFKIHQ